ncbi:fimbrial protein [Enterobacter hormaechei]|uniref:fimbrial protein n=1 Tax=Enterobacter hormaechei TaxID=158836 RepID=UPI00163BFC37|nr:fimbrial protein [Enterobacter hormaechei]MBF9761948.1 fimbrial protein [Enterobacter hormaechei]MBF9766144.1 fimbrial protein [Enterobacter hormaechei]MCM7726702.1 fimbrial protein [Enterobacter hormaechei]UTI05268.1 fimbrial protein [Enterobacter hormaechei subsp. steigerwaltii]HAV1392782.1 fimbrial protein [Enterobacter hormaechei subsp. steigerwaltii]
MKCLSRGASALMMVAAAGATAGPGSSNVDIAISGEVIATASCTFSSNEPIKVEFGDVYINEIAGTAYRHTIPYQVSCKGDPDGKTVQLQVSGTPAGGDASRLQTDASGLTIKLQNGSATLPLNHWIDFDSSSPPSLYAVLEKESGARFQDGQAFNATATLKVAYN